MNAAGTTISTRQDFPNLTVYERAGERGPVYQIAFKNPEWVEGGMATVAGLGFVAWGAIMFGGPFLFPEYAAAIFFGAFIAMMIYYFRTRLPWKIARAVELDTGTDRLRVFRNGKLKIERQLSRLVYLTVEEHPGAEEARLTRQQKGEKKPRPEEKQHCLVGWFGAGGAERLDLMARYEWPTRNSLFEVRQAILWANQRANERGAPSPFQEVDDDELLEVRNVGSQNLNPPLD